MPSLDIVNPGDSSLVEVFLHDGATKQTGKTVNVSIERISDGFFWNGSSFPDATYRTVALTEASPSNAHNDAVYRRTFTTPSADGQEQYDWSVDFTFGSGRTTTFKGSIRTIVIDANITEVNDSSTLAELSQGQPPTTPRLDEALMLLYMAMRNKRDTSDTLDEVHNDAGAVIAKATLSDDGSTFTKEKLATGP